MPAVDPLLRRSAAHVLVQSVDEPSLDDDAFHHIRRVLRLRGGAAVTVTDGAGSWRSCLLADGLLEPTGAVVVEPAPLAPITVAVSPPKGDRLEWMVAKCTELGVDRIVLIDAERTVVKLQPDRAERQLDRLRRIAAESAMQSRRVWLPVITGPEPVARWLADEATAVAEPGGRRLTAADTTVMIGPEGGWTDQELARVGDERRVSLAANVLRVETAAIAAVALLAAATSGPVDG